jgi:hypothetical protein
MEIKSKLVLTVFLTPLAEYIHSVYVDIPIINLMPMIFKTIEVGIALIVVSNPVGRFKNVRIKSIVILFPRVAPVLLQEATILPLFISTFNRVY